MDAKLVGPFEVVKLKDRSGISLELELPKHWRVHNVFHTSLLEPYCAAAKGLHTPPIAVTDRRYDDQLDMEHMLRHVVDGQQVLEDFEVEEIIESEYSTGRNKVVYFIKLKDYPEQFE